MKCNLLSKLIAPRRMVVASTPWMCTDCDLNTTSDDEARAHYEQCARCNERD